MNKKLVLALTFGLLFSTTGCNNSTPVYEDFEDSYTDALPSNSEDGTTLHAFCWTFNQIKENLPNIANAGFKNILTMPVQQPKGGGASWWAYYQPISFTIADNSALGTKDDLKSLCEEADKYNISILVDVVANHMANISDDELEDDKTPKVSPSVESYEPILYRNRNENVDGEHGVTFHHNPNANGSGAETQVYQYGALPDLNTGNEYVQQRVYSLLKECIDVGVDGFRFDAAKHIETSEDPEYASDFWENTLDKAKVYYNEKTNKNLYAYGEMLGSPLNRSVDLYTKHMRVTEDGYTSQFKGSTATHNASQVLNASLTKAKANESIAWVESHDEYTSTNTHIGNSKVAKFWGVIASRKDLGGLYLARPNSESQVGIIGDYQFESEYTACANRFHNRFVGASEYPSADGAIYVNENTSKDAVIASWWYFGYFFEYNTGRRAIGDGGTYNGRFFYFLANGFITKDEKTSSNIFKMLSYKGVTASEVIDKYIGNPKDGSKALIEALSMDKNAALKLLQDKYKLTEEQANNVIKYSHPEIDYDIILVITENMQRMKTAMSYYAFYDFEHDDPHMDWVTSDTMLISLYQRDTDTPYFKHLTRNDDPLERYSTNIWLIK